MVSYIDIHLSEEDLYKHTEELDLNCDQCHRGFKNINALRMHKVKTHNQVSTESDFRLRYRRQNPQKGLLNSLHFLTLVFYILLFLDPIVLK